MASLWTAELETELKRLHPLYSAAQVAAMLGNGFTRCSIIGKARRLGLSLPERPKAEPKVRTPRIPKTRSGEHHAVLKIVRNGGGGLRVMQTSTTEMPALRCVPVVSLNLSLSDVGDGCRYIKGSDHLYCGHTPFLKGMCRPHFELCWVPSPPKRDQARQYLGTDFAKLVQA